MAKSSKTSSVTSFSVRNERTGQLVTVRGAGSMKNSGFSIRKGIDLTQPIAQQALKIRIYKAKVPRSPVAG